MHVKVSGPVSKPPMSTAEEESISILLHVPFICSYQKLLSSLKVSPLSSERVGILEQSHGDTIVAQVIMDQATLELMYANAYIIYMCLIIKIDKRMTVQVD